MKIAITTAASSLSGQVELRFGRANSFCIYDTDTKDFTILDNAQQLNAAQGAGIQSAQKVISSGATTLISGHCGPKAMKVLSAKNIAVYVTEAATIQEALDALEADALEQITKADVEEHWVQARIV